MATLGANVVTLADWVKRQDTDGGVAAIAELLAQTNPILEDMHLREANLPTGHRTTVRTGLPDVYWRRFNQGVQPSKSTTAQIEEAIGMLEAWSEVDVDLAELEGDVSAFRMSEAFAFIEAMNQEMASTVFYGDSTTSPEEFNGLSARYNDLSAANAQNIIDAGGTGSDNTSIWLVVHGENTFFSAFPRGSQLGLVHDDLGEVTVETTAGIAGNRLRAYQDRFQWKLGTVLKDWRYVVRIANIDVSVITGDYDGSDGFTHDLQRLLIRAIHRIPNLRFGRPVFYVNRTLASVLDIQALEKASNQLRVDTFDGQPVTVFRGIPIRTVDALLETESRVV